MLMNKNEEDAEMLCFSRLACSRFVEEEEDLKKEEEEGRRRC